MKTKAAVILFIVCFVYIVGLIFVPQEYHQIMETFSLLATLAIVFVYTYETSKMQQSMSKQVDLLSRQIDLQIKPLLAIQPIRVGTSLKLRVANVGNGTAINIKFDEIKLENFSDISFKVDDILSLRPGEESEVKVQSFMFEEAADDMMTAHIDKDYATKVVKFNVVYCDIELIKITQPIKLGKGDFKTIQASNKLFA
jgi:hypothetical protein